MLFHPFGGHVESGGDCHRRTLHPNIARSFRHRPLVGAEPLDLSFDQLPKVFRNPQFEL